MSSHLGVFFVREWSTILNVHLLENVAFLSHSMTRPVGLVSLSYIFRKFTLFLGVNFHSPDSFSV